MGTVRGGVTAGVVRLQLDEGVYRVQVREAGTGSLVGEFEAPGSTSDRNSCPFTVEYRRGDEPDLARALGTRVYTERLQSFAEAVR